MADDSFTIPLSIPSTVTLGSGVTGVQFVDNAGTVIATTPGGSTPGIAAPIVSATVAHQLANIASSFNTVPGAASDIAAGEARPTTPLDVYQMLNKGGTMKIPSSHHVDLINYNPQVPQAPPSAPHAVQSHMQHYSRNSARAYLQAAAQHYGATTNPQVQSYVNTGSSLVSMIEQAIMRHPYLSGAIGLAGIGLGGEYLMGKRSRSSRRMHVRKSHRRRYRGVSRRRRSERRARRFVKGSSEARRHMARLRSMRRHRRRE